MFSLTSFRRTMRAYPESLKRDSLVLFGCLVQSKAVISSLSGVSTSANPLYYITYAQERSYGVLRSFLGAQHIFSPADNSVMKRLEMFEFCSVSRKLLHSRYMSSASIELKTDGGAVRFSFNKQGNKNGSLKTVKEGAKRLKMSKKAKRNELRFYRLMAKKKMNSSNPEVRIRYKLGKAKRKEAWLIEKLRKFEVPKGPVETYDPEILTEEERHYLKRTGEKKKNYVQVGRRGVFGGVVLNMHLHWKKHETVKIVCKPCKPGQIHAYAEEISRLSKGIVIDIKPDNTIIFYRGKNYVQPEVISPPNTLSKDKALEKYRYEQSLEHTSGFIEKLEQELEEYHKHIALYKKRKEDTNRDSLDNIGPRKEEI
ncbi:uncharacterized CRM domain-containing protein At3g25440, chloroplastic isoform X1 [Pistacia vera]|uniref:uncharacterized CRM domain-containing protein At3g25440, chloroplastic isoform X1 n=1 Tax=Pistacia vera TaxID=55513 RepID=UPI0012635449|nr:uncharacterized CRM domain-containing protein At3g25440, chloroplastic isoform X1 [Pistacia vera]